MVEDVERLDPNLEVTSLLAVPVEVLSQRKIALVATRQPEDRASGIAVGAKRRIGESSRVEDEWQTGYRINGASQTGLRIAQELRTIAIPAAVCCRGKDARDRLP